MSAEAKQVILLVDDTPANIQIALAILKDLYQVRVATNGEKALELAAGKPAPDLILLDVMMPGIDGFEVDVYKRQRFRRIAGHDHLRRLHRPAAGR